MDVKATLSEQQMLNEERKAREANAREEAKRVGKARRKPRKVYSPAERAAKAKELDELLRKSKIFSVGVAQVANIALPGLFPRPA